ncbi:MAG: hypothetical protein V3V08_02290 [Nannocystaceae bacterium]
MTQQTRDDADAFDDLLGQLVDELAMTPTVDPEPPPEVVPSAVRPDAAVVAAETPAMVHDAAATEFPAPVPNNTFKYAMLGGFVLVAIVAMLTFGGSEPPAKPATAQTVAHQQPGAALPATPGATPPAGLAPGHQPGTAVGPGGVPVVTQPGAAVPGVPAGNIVQGRQPGAVPGAIPPGQIATATPGKKRKKRRRKSRTGTKRPTKKKKKSSKKKKDAFDDL